MADHTLHGVRISSLLGPDQTKRGYGGAKNCCVLDYSTMTFNSNFTGRDVEVAGVSRLLSNKAGTPEIKNPGIVVRGDMEQEVKMIISSYETNVNTNTKKLKKQYYDDDISYLTCSSCCFCSPPAPAAAPEDHHHEEIDEEEIKNVKTKETNAFNHAFSSSTSTGVKKDRIPSYDRCAALQSSFDMYAMFNAALQTISTSLDDDHADGWSSYSSSSTSDKASRIAAISPSPACHQEHQTLTRTTTSTTTPTTIESTAADEFLFPAGGAHRRQQHDDATYHSSAALSNLSSLLSCTSRETSTTTTGTPSSKKDEETDHKSAEKKLSPFSSSPSCCSRSSLLKKKEQDEQEETKNHLPVPIIFLTPPTNFDKKDVRRTSSTTVRCDDFNHCLIAPPSSSTPPLVVKNEHHQMNISTTMIEAHHHQHHQRFVEQQQEVISKDETIFQNCCDDATTTNFVVADEHDWNDKDETSCSRDHDGKKQKKLSKRNLSWCSRNDGKKTKRRLIPFQSFDSSLPQQQQFLGKFHDVVLLLDHHAPEHRERGEQQKEDHDHVSHDFPHLLFR